MTEEQPTLQLTVYIVGYGKDVKLVTTCRVAADGACAYWREQDNCTPSSICVQTIAEALQNAYDDGGEEAGMDW